MSLPSHGPVTNQPDLGHELLFFGDEVKEEDLVKEPTSGSAKGPQTSPAPAATPATEPEDLAHEMLLYGHEQVLRGSDTGVLVAFAAIALKELKGDKAFHFEIGFGFLLFSVLMCAVVHYAVGGAYVRRARRLFRGHKEAGRPLGWRGVHMFVAWLAGFIQLGCIILGLLLVLLPEPPALLKEYVLPWFQ